jgi:hypothetical protein
LIGIKCKNDWAEDVFTRVWHSWIGKIAEATWTTSQRGSGLGKEKHCQDENRRAGGGWVYFKRLHF